MPPQIFKNKIIATAGPLPRQLTVENLKKWTALRHGTFLNEFDETVTHVLCTRDQFRDKKNSIIKRALKRRNGRRNVKVVHYEWYEFSAAYNERIPEQQYLMAGREADRRAKKREERRWQKGLEAGIDGVNPNLHHVYFDRENFRYQITLVHKDPEMGYVDEKYVLTLWESNAWPHLYWFTAKLTKSRNGRHFFSPILFRGAKHSIKWKTAYEQFTGFFEKKCKITWGNRVSHQGTQPTAFQYEPPTRGKPVGRRLTPDSYEYCLEINAQIKKELGIVDQVQVEEENKKTVGEEMEVDQEDDDDVDALREELLSEDEEDNDRRTEKAREAEEAGEASEVEGEPNENEDEADEHTVPSEDGGLEDCDKEETMDISTEDSAIQDESSSEIDVEFGESAEATPMDEDATPSREVGNTSPPIDVEDNEAAIPATGDAEEAVAVPMRKDEEVADRIELEYPTPISISIDDAKEDLGVPMSIDEGVAKEAQMENPMAVRIPPDEEQKRDDQPIEAVRDAVENDTVKAEGDTQCAGLDSGLSREAEMGIQQQDVPKVRKKLPNERQKLPDEKTKLSHKRTKLSSGRKKLPDGR